MRITYRGGFNKHDPHHLNDFVLATHAQAVQAQINAGKHIGVVTYAKDDGYYDEKVDHFFGEKVDSIDYAAHDPQWEKYDVLYLLGGDQLRLHEALLDHSFSLSVLKPDVHLVGDSAGAMVLSAHYYHMDDAGEISFYTGLHPNSKLIVVVHADNPEYVSKRLYTRVEEFAASHDLELLVLNENQEVTR